MNPKTTIRFRRITGGLAVAWALLALCLSLATREFIRPELQTPFSCMTVGGVHTVSWVAEHARGLGLEPGDRVVTVDGEPFTRWIRHRRYEQLQADRPNAYGIEHHDGRSEEMSLRPVSTARTPRFLDDPLYLGVLVVGAIYLFVGISVRRLKPERQESWVLLMFCSMMAMQLFSLSDADYQLLSYDRIMINFGLLGATGFHFFTLFPSEPSWVVRHPRVRLLPYIAAAAIGLLALVEEPLGLPARLVPSLAFFFAAGSVLVSAGIVTHERMRMGHNPAAQRADIVLMGFALSFLPVLGLLVAQMFLRLTFPVGLLLMWFGIFPLTVAYGVLRRELFDVRLLARSSAAHGLTTLAITGLFALVIAFADLLVWRFNVNARSPLFQVGFLFFAILLFNPLRNRLQAVVDRTFGQDQTRYRYAVREMSDAMVSMLSIKEIVDRILIALHDTMGVDRAAVLLVDDTRRALAPVAVRGDWDEATSGAEIPTGHPLLKQLWMRREALTRGDFGDEPDPEVRDACRDVFDVLEVALLVPILFGVDLIGVIAVGRKASGERLLPDDRQLLRTLANQSSIAIENAKAFDEIAQLNETLEARVDERTSELRRTQAQLVQNEKMVSLGQLVAGVAHELNNPIGFVHANLQLIEGYTKRLLDTAPPDDPQLPRMKEALEKLFRRSREGTERVKGIVENLRAFSRLDQAEVQEVDLHDGIDRTLLLMEPRLKDGVTVERSYGELPLVRCFAGQLNQVFMNLLTNACDAMDGDGHIKITTSTTPEGVLLSFKDTGPGIPPEIQNRLFEPFFTTKQVGKGTGLGLSLSHGIVERHGGRIYVISEPGEGADFRIELPLDPPAMEV